MDIIFQSGEFSYDSGFWSDLIVQIVGAIIGAIVAIYLFFRQLGVNKNSEEKKKKEFDIDKLKYLYTCLDGIIVLIDLQIKSIKKFIDEVSKDFVDVPLLSVYPTHDIDRLVSKINHEEYYHAFIRENRSLKEAPKKFRDLYSTLDYIDSSLKDMVQLLGRERLRDYDKKMLYVKHVEESEKKFLEAIKSTKDKNLKIELNELIIRYRKKIEENPSNLTIPKLEFLDVAISIMVEYMGTNNAFYDAAMQIKSARIAYSGIVMSNKDMVEHFINYKEGLEQNLVKLNEEIQLLEKYKT